MLQQVLRDLYVDPEILAALDTDEKQLLFCKMREEQIRRWTNWDRNYTQNTQKPAIKISGKRKKAVSFLQGEDGEPWVWVMGEHENDRTIEEILKGEALDKARQLAEREAVELRKQLSDFIDLSPKRSIESIYASVDEIKCNLKDNKNALNHYEQNNYINSKLNGNVLMNEMNRKSVSQKIAQWEHRLTEQRTCEILQKMQLQRLRDVQEAEENEEKHEQFWMEQQRKAKEAERQMREVARRAREEHRALGNCAAQVEPAYSAVAPGVPPGKEAVVDWYRKQEMPKNCGLLDGKTAEPYFHGLITRTEAESLLSDKDEGTFLVRLSERLWGYAISYKTVDKCKHYLVNAASGKYCFLGNNQAEHQSLGDLIKCHMQCPLTGGEKLKKPCLRKDDSSIRQLLELKINDDNDDDDDDDAGADDGKVTETTHI